MNCHTHNSQSNERPDSLIDKCYRNFIARINKARTLLQHPLTLTEKILYAHLFNSNLNVKYERGKDYVDLMPDRVAMQDATGQMAILQFINSRKDKVSVPTTIHCDHLITAQFGAKEDLKRAHTENQEVYDFLKTAAVKYGIDFWEPGSGIIHQILLENYAFPGGLMIGTDSHMPNAGGLGMLGIGVGGSDAVDVMVGLPWELRMPAIIGVELTGKLTGWTSAKDVILKLAGILGTKGATDTIIEYFGDGAAYLSCTGKATICNMGAELGATSSIFPFDDKMADFLSITGRDYVVSATKEVQECLVADSEIYATPEKYFNRVIRIDLNTLEPHINGPFSPDIATPISKFSEFIDRMEYPSQIDVGLIGSCTNSSYEDIARAASIARQANQNKIHTKSALLINPGTACINKVAEEAGFIQELSAMGALILANACGPCIGQWKRNMQNPTAKNSIITSFNRNFAKRNDGNPNTYAFLASPEIVTAMAIAGDLHFNPVKDTLVNENGKQYRFLPPFGDELPKTKMVAVLPELSENGNKELEIKIYSPWRINPNSERLQRLEAFPEWDGKSYYNLILLIKVRGKCTTDHISMAGAWLKYRGHLDKISDNLLLGAENAFVGKPGIAKNRIIGKYGTVAEVARFYKAKRRRLVIVADENYGEGSSREHAAMEPRYLGVVAVVAKSFARIHETNLKKQGILALVFDDPNDYNRIEEDDDIDIIDLENFSPGKPLRMLLKHPNGVIEILNVIHSYNDQQIEWFKAGSTMNFIRKMGKI